ncbi:MAG TPA: NAD(P)H-binding protein, partial [Polyangiaceae bacterium]
TAFARNPKGLGMEESDGFRIVTGDVLQPKTVDHAMIGQRAVLCAIGPRARTGIGETPTNVVSVATRHIIEAMEHCGTKRLISLSSVGVGDSRGQGGFFRESIVIPLFMKAQFRDKERQEEAVRESSVEWVLVRPTSLVDRPARGEFRVTTNGEGVPGRIARADVAAFMVDQLTSDAYLGKAPVIGG